MAPFLPAALASIITALGAYLLAVRKLSGDIDTTEASDLWEESRAMRQDYRDRLDASNQRTAAMEKRMAELERHNYELMMENVQCKEEIAKLRRVIELQSKLVGGNPTEGLENE